MRFEAFTANILNFSVKWSENLNDSLAPRSSAGYVFLDGQQTGGTIMDRGACSTTRNGLADSSTTERPYTFAQIQTSDRDEDHALDSSIGADFGTIVLKVCRGQRGAAVDQPTFLSSSINNDSLHELAVKKLKVTQRATLGAPVVIPRHTYSQFPLIDPISSPFIVFTFIYRSKTMLQALGVIEYKPEPVVASPPPHANAAAGPSSGARAKRPAQEVIDISSDEDDDDPDVARAARELAEPKKRAKARKEGVVDKKPKLENGEIIDLS